MKNIFTHSQLGSALNKTLAKHKKELGDENSKTKKVEWITSEAFKAIHELEKSMNKFNKENEKLKVNPKELITVFNMAINLILRALNKKKIK